MSLFKRSVLVASMMLASSETEAQENTSVVEHGVYQRISRQDAVQLANSATHYELKKGSYGEDRKNPPDEQYKANYSNGICKNLYCGDTNTLTCFAPNYGSGEMKGEVSFTVSASETGTKVQFINNKSRLDEYFLDMPRLHKLIQSTYDQYCHSQPKP